MGEFKALDTRYAGHKFRSRLEAKWAVYFDALGARWEYEKQGFNLGNGQCYLPDFWMPDLECWLEVKPEDPTPDEWNKCELLGQGTGRAVVIVWGMPEKGNLSAYCDSTLSTGPSSGAMKPSASESGTATKLKSSPVATAGELGSQFRARTLSWSRPVPQSSCRTVKTGS